jgi:ABC-2 type transport system permease protein
MIFKRGDPVGFLLGTVGIFLGGVFFPVSELPVPVQAVSYMLPITHGNMAFREIMLQGKPLAEVASQIFILAAFAAVFIPLSLFCFRKAVNRAQREGTLVQY